MILWCIAVGYFLSCNCESLAPIDLENNPFPFIVTRVDNNGQGQYIVSFNNSADTASIVLGKTLIIEGNAVGVIFIQKFPTQLRITPDCSGLCNLNVTLKGEGDMVVRSLGGQVLDGDKDGSDGGDFNVILQ
jgi:hypothetical protein